MLKALRNWLSPPLPSAIEVLRLIDEQGLAFSSMVYGGDRNVARTYSITITLKRDGYRREAEAEGRNFDEALGAAWAKWLTENA